MTFPILRVLFLAVALALPLFAQAAAGRVLVAVGDVTAQRGSTLMKLDRDSLLESGDVVRTGDASNVQLRFTDGALVALRANSQFAIDQYRFVPTEPGGAEEKGFFSLLKGGMRTISGLIGKKNRDAYAVGTPTATIGIRGTHYNLMVCQGNCRNNDGSLAKDGTYGTVYHGVINVSNQNGSGDFSRDQSFFVADAHSGINRLIAPPGFLQDKLDGQGKSKRNGGTDNTQQSQQTGQQQGHENISGPSQSSSSGPYTNGNNLPQVLTTENKSSDGNPSVLSGVGSFNMGDGVAPTATSALAVISATSTTLGGQHTVECDSDSCSAPTGYTTIQRDSQGFKSVHYGGYVDRNLATTAERGADGGVIEWGRWTGGPTAAGGWFNNLTFGPNQGFHYLVGSPAVSLPGSGTFTFALIGATQPTFSDGIGGGLGAGSVTGGSATVNFLAHTLNANLNLSFTGGNYVLNTSTTVSSAYVTGSAMLSKTSGAVDVCGGSTCSGFIGGFFAGPGATHLGLGYDITANAGGVFYINGVAVYKR